MRGCRAGWLVLGLASIVVSTGFATCGGDVSDETAVQEEEDAGAATIDEEQQDMERDIDR